MLYKVVLQQETQTNKRATLRVCKQAL